MESETPELLNKEKFKNKLQDVEKLIPFFNNFFEKGLKDNRLEGKHLKIMTWLQQQLLKRENLSLEALIKCEKALINIQTRHDKNTSSSPILNVKIKKESSELVSDIEKDMVTETPDSPTDSFNDAQPIHTPVNIPTERNDGKSYRYSDRDKSGRHSSSDDRHHKHSSHRSRESNSSKHDRKHDKHNKHKSDRHDRSKSRYNSRSSDEDFSNSHHKRNYDSNRDRDYHNSSHRSKHYDRAIKSEITFEKDDRRHDKYRDKYDSDNLSKSDKSTRWNNADKPSVFSRLGGRIITNATERTITSTSFDDDINDIMTESEIAELNSVNDLRFGKKKTNLDDLELEGLKKIRHKLESEISTCTAKKIIEQSSSSNIKDAPETGTGIPNPIALIPNPVALKSNHATLKPNPVAINKILEQQSSGLDALEKVDELERMSKLVEEKLENCDLFKKNETSETASLKDSHVISTDISQSEVLDAVLNSLDSIDPILLNSVSKSMDNINNPAKYSTTNIVNKSAPPLSDLLQKVAINHPEPETQNETVSKETERIAYKFNPRKKSVDGRTNLPQTNKMPSMTEKLPFQAHTPIPPIPPSTGMHVTQNTLPSSVTNTDPRLRSRDPRIANMQALPSPPDNMFPIRYPSASFNQYPAIIDNHQPPHSFNRVVPPPGHLNLNTRYPGPRMPNYTPPITNIPPPPPGIFDVTLSPPNAPFNSFASPISPANSPTSYHLTTSTVSTKVIKPPPTQNSMSHYDYDRYSVSQTGNSSYVDHNQRFRPHFTDQQERQRYEQARFARQNIPVNRNDYHQQAAYNTPCTYAEHRRMKEAAEKRKSDAVRKSLPSSTNNNPTEKTISNEVHETSTTISTTSILPQSQFDNVYRSGAYSSAAQKTASLQSFKIPKKVAPPPILSPNEATRYNETNYSNKEIPKSVPDKVSTAIDEEEELWTDEETDVPTSTSVPMEISDDEPEIIENERDVIVIDDNVNDTVEKESVVNNFESVTVKEEPSTVKQEKTDQSDKITSSVSPVPSISGHVGQGIGKEELNGILESFFMKMMAPTAPDHLLTVLEKVVEKDKFEKIREIITSSSIKDNTSETDPKEGTSEKQLSPDESTDDVKLIVTSPIPAAPRHGKRMTELQKLNEDIRTMFISDGVLTATGRRMCTVIKETDKPAKSSVAKPTRKQRDFSTDSEASDMTKASSTDHTSPITRSSRSQKSIHNEEEEEQLEPRRVLRSRKSVPDDDQEEQSKTRGKTSKDDKSRNPSVAVNTRKRFSGKEKPSKSAQITIYSSNESSSSSDEEEPEPIKKSVKKPLNAGKGKATKQVKGKKQVNKKNVSKNQVDLVSSDSASDSNKGSDDDEQGSTNSAEWSLKSPKRRLRGLKILLEKVPCPPEPKQRNNSSDSHPCSQESDKSDDQELLKDDKIKNIDRLMHCMSKDYMSKCTICHKTSNKVLIVGHYVNCHPESEVYCSRPPPVTADQLRNFKRNIKCKPIMENSQIKYKAKCPLCSEELQMIYKAWIKHITTHTGEYIVACQHCHHRRSTRSNHKCGVQYQPYPPYVFNDKPTNKSLSVYMCDICNYTQLTEDNIKTHVRKEHEKKAIGNYIEVVVFQITDSIKQPNRRASVCKAKKTNDDENKTDKSTVKQEDENVSPPRLEASIGTPNKPADPDAFIAPKEDEDLFNQDTIKFMENISFIASELPSQPESMADRLTQRFRTAETEQDEQVLIEMKLPLDDYTIDPLQPADSINYDTDILEPETTNTDKDESQPNPSEDPLAPDSGTTVDLTSDIIKSVNNSIPNIENTENLPPENDIPSQNEQNNIKSPDNPDYNEPDNVDDNDWESCSSASDEEKQTQKKNDYLEGTVAQLRKMFPTFSPGKKSKKCNASRGSSISPDIPKMDTKINILPEVTPIDNVNLPPEPESENKSDGKTLAEILAMPEDEVQPASLNADVNAKDPPKETTVEVIPPTAPVEVVPETVNTNLNFLKELVAKPQNVEPLRTPEKLKNISSGNTSTINRPKITLKCSPKIINIIDNIGYSNNSGIHIFYCSVKGCGFESRHSKELLNHLDEHCELWGGFCLVCENSVMADKQPLFIEFKHMMEKHLNTQDPSINKEIRTEKPVLKFRRLPGDTLSTTPKLLKSTSDSIPSIQPVSSVSSGNMVVLPRTSIKMDMAQTQMLKKPNMPRTKFVPKSSSLLALKSAPTVLSLSKPHTTLSNTLTTMTTEKDAFYKARESNSPVSSSIPNISISIPTAIQSPTSLQTDSNSVITRNLKPWTSCEVMKSDNICETMLLEFVLFSLFKCMGMNCNFSTCSSENMIIHLKEHERLFELNMQNSVPATDSNSWLECAYCEMIEGSCSGLVQHINLEHSTSIFQCKYCFYRSVTASNIILHNTLYHTNKKAEILICDGITKFFSNEKKQILQNRVKYVHQLVCSDCNLSSYILSTFLQHVTIRKHKETLRCQFCAENTPLMDVGEHLLTHGIGIFQCIYCFFGSNDVQIMREHMANIHSDKLLYICTRLHRNDIAYNMDSHKSIECTILTFIGELVDRKSVPFTKCPYTDTQLSSISPHITDDFSSVILLPDRLKDPSLNAVGQNVTPITICSGLEISNVNSISEETYANKSPQLSDIQPETESSGSVDNSYILSFNDLAITYDFNDISKLLSIGDKMVKQSTEEQQQSADVRLQDEIDKAARALVIGTGLFGKAFYRCAYDNCSEACEDLDKFVQHQHQHSKSSNFSNFKCYHCGVLSNTLNVLNDHLNIHGIHRFFCYYCDYTAPVRGQLTKHMTDTHNKSQTNIYPLNKDKTNLAKDIFVLAPKIIVYDQIRNFGVRLVERYNNLMTSTKTQYSPDEIELLPNMPVFSNLITCSVCSYSTKIRTNILRHLIKHKNSGDAPSVDPVNPVPCLNTGEKHFDRMINLACSSNDSAGTQPSRVPTNVPVFVPLLQRFICSAPNCSDYFTSEDLFRNHIQMKHTNLPKIACAHCKLFFQIDQIVEHLRMHDTKIYSCIICSYVHYLKSVVKSHIENNHKRVDSLSMNAHYREENPNSLLESASKITNTAQPTISFKCTICSNTFATRNLIAGHLSEVHAITNLYQCGFCACQSNNKQYLTEHCSTKHEGIKIKSFFSKSNDSKDGNLGDTTPIWRRDDPNKIKHIRGILFEDEPVLKRRRKRISRDILPPIETSVQPIQLNELDNPLEIIDVMSVSECPPEIPSEISGNSKPSTSKHDNIQTGTDSNDILDFEKRLTFFCYYCDHEDSTSESIYSHWHFYHKDTFNPENGKKIPFLFKVDQLQRCFYCQKCGTYDGLKKHCELDHVLNPFITTDYMDRMKCGECEFVGESRLTLREHYCAAHTTFKRNDSWNSKSFSYLINIGFIKQLKCCLCNHTFLSKIEYANHACFAQECCEKSIEMISNDISYKCSICDEQTNKHLEMIIHIRSHCDRFGCAICNRSFDCFIKLTDHHLNVHNITNRPYRVVDVVHMKSHFSKMQLIFPNCLVMTKEELNNTNISTTMKMVHDLNVTEWQQNTAGMDHSLPVPTVSAGNSSRKSFGAAPLSVKLRREYGESYYGCKPESIDLSQVYTTMKLGEGMEIRTSCDRFAILVNIDAQVLVEPMSKKQKLFYS